MLWILTLIGAIAGWFAGGATGHPILGVLVGAVIGFTIGHVIRHGGFDGDGLLEDLLIIEALDDEDLDLIDLD